MLSCRVLILTRAEPVREGPRLLQLLVAVHREVLVAPPVSHGVLQVAQEGGVVGVIGRRRRGRRGQAVAEPVQTAGPRRG